MTADREGISADGEDVAMFAVEVQDAQGRPVPTADNEVNFRVTGAGKIAGVGNGDPTCHESDPGSSRKAFSGLCMALVQAGKAAGNITVEASSPGLTAGYGHHRRQSGCAPPAGCGLGARSPGGIGHHGTVETGTGGRGCGPGRFRNVRWRGRRSIHLPAEWQ